MRTILLPGFVVAGLCPSLLASQSVRGRAVIRGTDVPATEAAVILVDSAGSIVAGTMTAADGTFNVRAPRPGTYRVRVRRIGFSPDSSALFNFQIGSAVTFNPALRQLASVELPAVSVKVTKRCVLAPEAGAAAIRIWDEAKNALSGAAASALAGQFAFTLGRFEREVDVTSSEPIRSRSWTLATTSSESYMSISPESLSVHGFARAADHGATYYAPDARTLLSQIFASTHCLHPVTDPAHADLVGLGFAPVRETQRTDVSGVLWLDRKSAELRYLEFHYTGEGSGKAAGAVGNEVASGRVDYERLPGGAWIVSHWLIRAPVVAIEGENRFSGGSSVGAVEVVRRDTVRRIISMWEAGGDVRAVSARRVGQASDAAPDSRSADNNPDNNAERGEEEQSANLAQVRGSLSASTSDRRRLAGFRVQLIARPHADGAPASNTGNSPGPIDAPFATSPDTSGAFVFRNVPPGQYSLHTTSAWLDTLTVHVADTPLSLEAGAQVSVRITIPSETAVMESVCGSDAIGSGVLHGTVRDSATSHALAGVKIQASWFGNATVLAGARQVSMATEVRSTVSDNDGRYTICGLPLGKTVTVRADVGERASLPLRLSPGVGRDSALISTRDIVLPGLEPDTGRVATTRSAAGAAYASFRGRIGGTVVDAYGRGLPGVEVSLMDATEELTHSDSSGGFRLDDAPLGNHIVRFRRLGLSPLYVKVSVAQHAVAEADAMLTLAAAPVRLLPTVTVRGSTLDTLMLPAGLSDRMRHGTGSYISYAEIQREHPVRTTDLFRRVPGVQLGRTGAIYNNRGVTSLLTDGCKYGLPIYVDGNLLADPHAGADTLSGTNVADLISPSEIVAIEIYRGASELPGTLPRNPCGGVFIWTRRM